MTPLDALIQSILFHPAIMRVPAYQNTRARFRAGKMRESSKFSLLRKFGYGIEETAQPVGVVVIRITPPDTPSPLFDAEPPVKMQMRRFQKRRNIDPDELP